MTEVTAQDLFNQVWDWFVVREMPLSYRVGSDVRCAYRGANGAACGVGCLLTDEEAAGLDDKPDGAVDMLARHGHLPDRLIAHVGMLSTIQEMHDCAGESRALRAALHDFAASNKFGVTAPAGS